MASNRYLAQLTVGYDPTAVRGLLQGQAFSYAETASEPLVMLPVYQVPGGPRLWPEDNPWWQAWAEHLDPERLLRLVLPLGDLEDHGDGDVDGAVAGDAAALETLGVTWYGRRRVIAATPRAAPRRRRRRGVREPRCSSSTYAAVVSRATRPRRSKAVPGKTLQGLMAAAVTGIQDTLDER